MVMKGVHTEELGRSTEPSGSESEDMLPKLFVRNGLRNLGSRSPGWDTEVVPRDYLLS